MSPEEACRDVAASSDAFRSRRATGGLLQDGAAPQRRAVRYPGNGSWTIVVRLVEDDLEGARSTAAVKLR